MLCAWRRCAPEIKCRKPASPYPLYQESGLLPLIPRRWGWAGGIFRPRVGGPHGGEIKGLSHSHGTFCTETAVYGIDYTIFFHRSTVTSRVSDLFSPGLHGEINYKNPQTPSSLYLECGCLALIPPCGGPDLVCSDRDSDLSHGSKTPCILLIDSLILAVRSVNSNRAKRRQFSFLVFFCIQVSFWGVVLSGNSDSCMQ